MEAADRSRGLGIPATVLVIEAWSDEATFSIWNEALYEPRDPALPFHLVDFSFPEHGLWPDPRRMIAELHARGLKVVLWQIPVLKKISGNPQHDRDLEFVRKRGWYVRNPDGSPYAVRPPWFREAMVLDFTNPDARRWWFNRRRYLVREIGVDGFKTDGGEHLWGSGLRFFDGSTSEQMANLFSNTYIGAYRAFLEDQEGAEALTFSRAGYMGAQRFPMHWAGDQDSTWESHRAVLRAVMNANLSGIPFVGWDIGGFAGPVPTPELYLRSAAMALFSPLMQYHSDFNGHRTPIIDRTPWNIAETSGDESVIAIYRRLARARMALVPYIFQEAQWCAREHEPLMRPLFLDWPDSAEAWRCQDQYLFGRGLLVAPVLSAGVTARAVYLPEGEWECLHTGARLVGERTVTWAAPVERIPAFVRQGSAFPVDEVRAALLG
jgi:alpha-glucosidase (family GH31 glycosyl hydrolase)